MVGLVGFVGREGELSRLLEAVGEDARLALVMGDAGVGKTRFVIEGMRRVAGDGTVAVWGGCLPMRETLPLLPLADALGELSRMDRGALLESALAVAPRYVRVEVARLLPELGPGTVEPAEPDSGQRDRLFAAIADLFGGVARRRRIVLVVEDVHWADAATLDCLTFLSRAHRDPAVPVVVTCRSDEAPLEPHVVEWLARSRERGGVMQIGLGPLSREEVAEHVAVISGSQAPAVAVDELYARAEGNPFFTEQLVASASADGVLPAGVGLPVRLAELLVTRAARCSGVARTVLSTLAVAGRPLGEELIGAVSGLAADDVRIGLRELTAARLLADAAPTGEQRPRHALLAEAVAADLLPSEKTSLHERLAEALRAAGDDAFAAEMAGHWAAAGRAAEELPARVRAAEAAERVFGYADAAIHWQRAIALYDQLPDAAQLVAIDLPRLYLRGMDALGVADERPRQRQLADEAYRRFADHPDPAVAASVHLRHAWEARWNRSLSTIRPAFEHALSLFERLPPSVEQAKAWLSYGLFMFHVEGRGDARRAAYTRALAIAEAAGATGVAASVQMSLAHEAFLRGEVAEGLAIIERARAIAEASDDGQALAEVAGLESDSLSKLGRFDEAAEAGLRAIRHARESGRHVAFSDITVGNAAIALLARGRTTEAARLIDPLTDEPVSRDRYPLHAERAEIDLLRGHLEVAATRLQQIRVATGGIPSVENAREIAQRAAEVAVWAGRPAEGLVAVRDVLARLHSTDWTIQCGWLLAVGMRACADLADRGRANRDQSATQAALATAGDLETWVDRIDGNPFVDHPYVATIPAERATWNAERSRLPGTGDPEAWQAAADAWVALGVPHRAGYAGWRHAESRLLGGESPAAVASILREAATAADGHIPLQTVIHTLADRARISLDRSASAPAEPPDAAPYGITERELLVLRLLAAGRSNSEIGTELFISRKTASVHVSNILRKLGVSNRAQAAALAERAGMVSTSSTPATTRSAM